MVQRRNTSIHVVVDFRVSGTTTQCVADIQFWCWWHTAVFNKIAFEFVGLIVFVVCGSTVYVEFTIGDVDSDMVDNRSSPGLDNHFPYI
jgi:hypothetical protein